MGTTSTVNIDQESAAAALVSNSNDVSGAASGANSVATSGATYWRSIGEFANDQGFQDRMAVADKELRDFVDGGESADSSGLANEKLDVSRRRFLKLAAASMALAGVGLTGCRRWPKEHIVPFAAGTEGAAPGVAERYATIIQRDGIGRAALATTVDGRPIKLDGNPNHPANVDGAGTASDVFMQASTLELYDPDRPRVITYADPSGAGRVMKSWGEFAEGWSSMVETGPIAVIAEPDSSSTLAALREDLAAKYPNLKWVTWSPVAPFERYKATAAAFGKPMRPRLDLSQADRIVSFGADFMGAGEDTTGLSAGWAKRRRSCDEDGSMSRMVVFESDLSVTGAAADHRIAVKSALLPALLAALAGKLGVAGFADAASPEEHAAAIEAIAKDLTAHQGKSVVLAGEQLDADAQQIAIAINAHLGAIAEGGILSYVDESSDAINAEGQTGLEALAALTQSIKDGEIKGLVILGGNPVYDAPADLGFAEAIAAIPVIHHSLYVNETSIASTWHLPESHPLETWGDAAGLDGTIALQQPMILPLWDSRSRIELLAIMTGDLAAEVEMSETGFGGYGVVFDHFRAGLTPNVRAWRKALHQGFIEGTSVTTAAPTPAAFAGPMPVAPESRTGTLMEVNLSPSPVRHDGRFANSGWLQELAQPITKLTWDNAALISYQDAQRMDINSGDKINLKVARDGDEDITLTVPAMIVPGTAKGTITLHLGFGRTEVGQVGGTSRATAVGVDAYPIRTTNAMASVSADVSPAGGRAHELATTQEHHLLDGVMVNPGLLQQPVEWINQSVLKKRVGPLRGSGYVIKENTLEGYLENPGFVRDGEHGDVHLQMFEAPAPFNTGRHAWGMAIDMTTCTGCNACVAACQAENNIPVVGKDQVLMSREMAWLRIDRYFKGDPKTDNVQVVHQPLACVHCENAPCEQVCPFGATVHDTEGMNTMVYNRCAGTRYCSNNCPYKVRRYNYFDYHVRTATAHGSNWKKPWLGIPDQEQDKGISQVKRMMFNPEVTVRMRGVMEKCTYCTQRIQTAKTAKRIAWAEKKKVDPSSGSNVNQASMITDEDGLMTACQEACPTRAIVFGNLNDPNSEIAKIQGRNRRSYDLLSELNTKPRTKYLAKISNPDPALEPEPKSSDADAYGH